MSISSSLIAGLTRLITLIAVSVLISTTSAADTYQDQLRTQLEKIACTEEQIEPFRAVLAEYYRGRNSALARARKKTHMDYVPCEPKNKCDRILAKRIGRELGIEADKSVEAMSAVLTQDQLVHYEMLVEIANDQFMARAGLK